MGFRRQLRWWWWWSLSGVWVEWVKVELGKLAGSLAGWCGLRLAFSPALSRPLPRPPPPLPSPPPSASNLTTPTTVNTMNLSTLSGRTIKVAFASSNRRMPSRDQRSKPPSRHLFVGQLPAGVVEADLRKAFEEFGRVEAIKLLPRKDGSRGGAAFVDFESQEDAMKAHDSDDVTVAGQPVRLDYNEPKSGKSFRDADHKLRGRDSYRDARDAREGGARWRDDRGRDGRGRDDRGREDRGREDRGREDRGGGGEC